MNNPTERFSTNQVIGLVSISTQDNPDLLDQANRLGLQQNAAFADLRQLVLAAIGELEARTLSVEVAERKSARLGGSVSPQIQTEVLAPPALDSGGASRSGTPIVTPSAELPQRVAGSGAGDAITHEPLAVPPPAYRSTGSKRGGAAGHDTSLPLARDTRLNELARVLAELRWLEERTKEASVRVFLASARTALERAMGELRLTAAAD